MYVPDADRIAATISRSPFRNLRECLDRQGDRVSAHEGPLVCPAAQPYHIIIMVSPILQRRRVPIQRSLVQQYCT
jgi:hypothetical protein